jgi:hypothetical protein
MVLGHSLFKIHIGKQFTRPYIRTAHRSLRYPPAQESDSPYNVSPAIEFFSSLLEGTEDSINHSSAAAASAPVKPQIGIDPASSDRGSFYPPVRMRMEPQLKDADYRIQIV